MRTLYVLVIASAAFLGPLFPAAAEKPRWQTLKNNPQCAVWNGSPLPEELATWTGPCVDGKAHGSGALVWSYIRDGAVGESRYEGNMRNGQLHGRGAYTWYDGAR